MSLSPSVRFGTPSRRSQSPVTTTTSFAAPSFFSGPAHARQSVPIPAIVGGSCAGILIAIMAVIGWKWWGRSIKKQQMKEFERRRAVQAAIAYRKSVTSGKKNAFSPPRRPVKTAAQKYKPHTHPSVQFTAMPLSSTKSMPEPILRETSNQSIPNSKKDKAATTRSLKRQRPRAERHPSTGQLLPSPLAPVSFQRTARPGQLQKNMPMNTLLGKPINDGSRRGLELNTAIYERSERDRTARVPKAMPSLATVLNEKHRQSKASQSSGSEYSINYGSDRSSKWSWKNLINGQGFSLLQMGIGTAKNRLSADTSSLNYWEEENPNVPIGYASNGEEDNIIHSEQYTDGQGGESGLDYPLEYIRFCERYDFIGSDRGERSVEAGNSDKLGVS